MYCNTFGHSLANESKALPSFLILLIFDGFLKKKKQQKESNGNIQEKHFRNI